MQMPRGAADRCEELAEGTESLRCTEHTSGVNDARHVMPFPVGEEGQNAIGSIHGTFHFVLVERSLVFVLVMRGDECRDRRQRDPQLGYLGDVAVWGISGTIEERCSDRAVAEAEVRGGVALVNFVVVHFGLLPIAPLPFPQIFE